jgi:hypothetical protein
MDTRLIFLHVEREKETNRKGYANTTKRKSEESKKVE